MVSRLDDLEKEYMSLLHAVQTGVAHLIEGGEAEASPKHLRVGVNSALMDSSALYTVLEDKGLITREEYMEKLVELAKREVDDYTNRVRQLYGNENITLG